jgi:FixJ family two-component response regulator
VDYFDAGLRRIKAALTLLTDTLQVDAINSNGRNPGRDQGHVVIVEDDEALRTAIGFTLEVEGFSVVACSSAEQVLEEMPFPAACLVVDYLLPGANGLALLTRLRGLGVQTPAILITTHPNSLVRARAASASAQILEKPLQGDSILQAIAGVTHKD